MRERKEKWVDPVVLLKLEGTIVGALPCPFIVLVNRRRKVCGEQAILLKFPEPYGLRARCEDGHSSVVAPTAIPSGWKPDRYETD